MDHHRLEPRGKRIYKRRKETVERSFADAKQLHGHRYARMRGLTKVQGTMSAGCHSARDELRLVPLLWLMKSPSPWKGTDLSVPKSFEKDMGFSP